jgi:hypothetical protein
MQLPTLKQVISTPDGLYHFPDSEGLTLTAPEFEKLKSLMGETVLWLVIVSNSYPIPALPDSEDKVDLSPWRG